MSTRELFEDYMFCYAMDCKSSKATALVVWSWYNSNIWRGDFQDGGKVWKSADGSLKIRVVRIGEAYELMPF